MTKIANETCVKLNKDSAPISGAEISQLKPEVPEWEIREVEGVPRLKRTYTFDNFVQALEFTNAVGQIAEAQDHHPLITLTWGKVTIEWWTHHFKGLHRNDFIMAAKTDMLYR